MNPLRICCALLLSVTCIGAPNRFVVAGAPAPDRQWIGSDYVAFAASIAKNRYLLPTLSDAEGKEIFLRVINRENFEFYQNSALPANVRLQSAAEFQQGLNGILNAYLSAVSRGAKVQRELAELNAMTLHTAAIMYSTVEEVLRDVPENAPNKDKRDTGLRQVKSGIVQIVNGTEISLGDRQIFSETERSLLLQALLETLPRLVSSFSENQTVELKRKMEKRRAEFKGKKDSERLEQIIATLSAPLPIKKG
jgi:hypothetical protein